MWNRILRFITPPEFPNEENKSRAAGYVHWIALLFMVAIILYIVLSKAFTNTFTLNLFDAALIAVFLGIYTISYLSRSGYVNLAGGLLVGILWFAVNGTAYVGAGVRDSSYIANFAVLLAAGLLLGWKAAVALSVITIATGIGFAYAEFLGIAPSVYVPTSPLTAMLELTPVFLIFAIFIYQLINGLERAIEKTRAGAKKLEEANVDLNAARTRLEESRNELIEANQQLKQRAERINSIANISKTITLIQEVERLLPSVVNAISERFGYNHVGVYLLDESNENALLRASSSESGLRLIRRKRRVKVASDDDIIGGVTERGAARVAEPQELSSQLRQSDFPDTRSQLALPLKIKEIVIGALDIHSNQENAFSQEDVSTLQILADQVAIAIQNSRSAEQARDALHQAEIVSRQLTIKAWREFAKTDDRIGYRYDGLKPEPLTEPARLGNAEKPLTIPIVLRGQAIGRLKLNPTEQTRHWTEDEIAMAEATAERVALALESARLLDDAQKRAQRETFLSEVSSKLGASFQLDSILRDTVEELGQTFRNATVSFQLVNPKESPLERSNADGNETK
ncbi:MAG: GAF domain-containing protein [Anaerolineales bacterium]|nr:GAF domain-containing protein [Anaerolineales bacterium]